MALIVEDGTGLPDAESYISVADADAYFAARSNAAWAALAAPAKEAALRKAADYIGAVYGERWKGVKLGPDQALDWPRALVERKDFRYAGLNGFTMISGRYYYPSDYVPIPVARAAAELAVRAAAETLLADQGGQVKSETVGPISVTYADGARQGIRYALVDGLLAPFLGAGSGQVSVARA